MSQSHYIGPMNDAADPRPVILLTGFGPFPAVPDNASGRLVRALARKARRAVPNYRIASAILPTQWRRAPAIVAAKQAQLAPVISLHFGVAADATGYRIETVAQNGCRLAEDAAGYLPASDVLAANAPAQRASNLIAEDLKRYLEAQGYPATISQDAGRYLCNAVLFQALAREAIDPDCRIGFIHVPIELAASFGSEERAVNGALAIINFLLSDRQAQTHVDTTCPT